MGVGQCKPAKGFVKCEPTLMKKNVEEHRDEHVIKHGTSTVDPRAKRAIRKHFPGAHRADIVLRTTRAVFKKYGFNEDNTLFASSTCPDEINCVIDDFSLIWGEHFSLGGLAGLPFTGKTGFTAFSHHVPEKDGRLLIFFAPHIGVASDGKTGKVHRLGIKKVTSACGSCIAAQNTALSSKRCKPCDDYDGPIGDYQQSVVTEIVSDFIQENQSRSKTDKLAKVEGDMNVKVTENLYERIKEEILKIIPDDFKKPIGLIGGILINTDYGNRQHDYILIKDLLIRKKNKKFVSLETELENALDEPRFSRLVYHDAA
eukprot:CAMPEP_0167800136 /NCGR_PEP_ID=MMETSP0111_2-20121227/17535_1 /TAXON_ID=91324 /ORGANISM="Lotharella globosa, Strain CCCM811" /LENGTH=314 /DNA_ID=CAMNT_0007695305 /DNA_START=50 /DNA_END=994 /DNA_ORIENTATION=-